MAAGYFLSPMISLIARSRCLPIVSVARALLSARLGTINS